MHVELRKSGDVVIVDLKGKLTAGLGDQILRETIDELLAESWKKILLNLSEVSLHGQRRPRRAGGRAQDGAQPRRQPEDPERQRARAVSALHRRLLPVFEIYEDEKERARAASARRDASSLVAASSAHGSR